MEKVKITVNELLSILDIDASTLMSICIINNGWQKTFYPNPETQRFEVDANVANRIVDRCVVWHGEDEFGNPDCLITIFLL